MIKRVLFYLFFCFFLAIKSHALCSVDSDCLSFHTLNCQNFTCVAGNCIQTDYYCPSTTEVCMGNPGVCSTLDNICYYPVYDCNDNNPCTNDFCVPDPLDNSQNQCINSDIPNCMQNGGHVVSFDVDDVNALDVYHIPDTDEIQICHSSTYRGANSATIISFDPYQWCTLDKRGNCDNHLKQANRMIVFQVSQSDVSSPPPCVPIVANSFVLDITGWSESFVWDYTILPPVFTDHPENDSVHVHGYVTAGDLPGLLMRVDLWFSGKYNHGSPYTNLDPDCYNAFNVDFAQWDYFGFNTGTLTGVANTPYEGLHITLESPTPMFTQLGFGANGMNARYGMWGTFSWTVISQPYDNSYYVAPFNSPAVFMCDIYQTLVDENNYCSLFGEPQLLPANGWTVDLNVDANLITYCKNFTASDLLACRNGTDRYTPLFTYSNSNDHEIEYIGQVHATTISAQTCEYMIDNADGDVCAGETILDTAVYNISITTSAKGRTMSRFTTSYTDFDIYWMGNVWLCGPVDGGNLQVKIRTRINDADLNANAYLCNPRIDLAYETGYPLVFDDPLAPDCEQIGNYCYQDWILRTFDGVSVVDFSGYKPFIWDVCDGLLITSTVHVAMNLYAIHVGDQSHVNDTSVTAEISLYTNRVFTVPYDSSPLVDGDSLYGTICLLDHTHLDLRIKQVYICYSKTADITPYDPFNPTITGCNTPGIDVQQHLLYSSEFADIPLLDDPRVFRYVQLFDPPSVSYCDGFSFVPKAATPFTQSIQIVWCAQENGGEGAMIELFSEVTQLPSSHHQRDVTITDWADDNLYSVICAPGQSWNDDLFMCTTHGSNDDDDSGHGDDDDHLDAQARGWLLLAALLLLIILFVALINHFVGHRMWWSNGKVIASRLPYQARSPSKKNVVEEIAPRKKSNGSLLSNELKKGK